MKNLILIIFCLITTLSLTPSFAFDVGTISSTSTHKTIEVSILSEKEALENFTLLANDPSIPFNYPKDGCFVRAHLMAHKLEELGIIVGKSFFVGRILVPTSNGPELWRYHVAPVILVNNGSSIIPTIFDPSLFPRPVSVTEFKKLLTKSPSSKVTLEFYTNRFAITPDDKDANYTDYQLELENQVKIMLDKITEMTNLTNN